MFLRVTIDFVHFHHDRIPRQAIDSEMTGNIYRYAGEYIHILCASPRM